MKRNSATLIIIFFVFAILQSHPVKASVEKNKLIVLSYHDIRDSVSKGDGDAYATSTQNFTAHMDWLVGHDYTPVSLQQVIDASNGKRDLPDKAILLSFDDGLRSVYTHVYPILRAYRFPAVLGIVSNWVDLPASEKVAYGPRDFSSDDFLTWQQLREMQASGLFEIASHSHDLHHGVISNPQGNSTPAAATRQFIDSMQRYESTSEYLQRIEHDLSASTKEITRQLGVRPRSIIWPYAAYNSETTKVADALGMKVSFDLEGREQNLGDNLHGLARLLVVGNPDIRDLVYELKHDQALLGLRSMQINLDDYYSAESPEATDANLGKLLERIKSIKPGQVVVNASSDGNKDGIVDAVYFPNEHLPVRADIFNRFVWQLRTRAGVQVYALLPTSSYAWQNGAEKSQRVGDLYEAMAVAGAFSGIVFDDASNAEKQKYANYLYQRASRWRPKLTHLAYANSQPMSFQTIFESGLPAIEARLPEYDYIIFKLSLGQGEIDARQIGKISDYLGAHSQTRLKIMLELWLDPGFDLHGVVLQKNTEALVAAGFRHLALMPFDELQPKISTPVVRQAMSANAFPYDNK